jgi:hypothetical protein
MSDHVAFMIFGAAIAAAGFWLSTTANTGNGHANISLFGGKFTVGAAGGVVVILFGILTATIPYLLHAFLPNLNQTPPENKPINSLPPDHIFLNGHKIYISRRNGIWLLSAYI